MTPPRDMPPFDDFLRAEDGARRDDAEPRRFPGESEWLELPLPSSAELRTLPRDEFVDGVLQALHDEAALDAQLRAFDRELPSGLLQAWDVPEPAPGFVARTMAAARDDRRTHWHHLLARYVAPEPSPQFVARTLAALAAEVPGSSIPGGGSAGGRGARPSDRGRWRRLGWPLIAAAAALLLWALPGNEPKVPFELRVVRGTPAAYVHTDATSPLVTVIATRDNAAEPDALVEANADGVWLLTEAGR